MKTRVKDLKPGMICLIPEPTLPDERVEVDEVPVSCNCRARFQMGAWDLYVNGEVRPRHFEPNFEVEVLS
jgi:hypothetical protein